MRMRTMFAIMLALNLGWTAGWLWRTQQDSALRTYQLSELLAPEVLVDGDKSALWRRFNSLAGVDGAQLLNPDHQVLAAFGTHRGAVYESPLIESGRLVGYLRLRYTTPDSLWVVMASWTLLLVGLLGWGYRARRRPALMAGPVLLDLDGNHQIRHIRGDWSSLGGAGSIEVGHKLGPSLQGKLVQRVGSQEEGRSSLVIVRNTQAWEGLQKRVRQLKDHYCSLCDFAHDLILVSQPEGMLVFANKALLQFFPQLEAGSDIWALFDPACRGLAQDKFRRCILETEAMPFLARLSLPDGQFIPIEGSFCPGLVESGVSVTVLGIFRDLTSQRQAEEELRQAQKMEAVGRLAGGIAHDFNNLLTVIGAASSLLRADPEKSDEYLELLDETVDRAGELTRQLLLFTRRTSAVTAPLALDTVLENLCRLARRLLGEDIALHTDFRSGCYVLADRSELEQLAMNLLVNARDAMPNGGRLDVVSQCCPWNGRSAAQLQIRDSGCGMSAELVERIFEPYFTTKEVGKGTGLGLSTTYAVVARLQGNIAVSSSPGQGTTFTIHLPTVEGSGNQAIQVSEPTTAPAHEFVMLVEDEESLCKATTRILRKLGYEVAPWVSPLEALASLQASGRCPNLLITDLIMPGLNGAELARQARQIHPDLQVLFVSGYSGDTLEGFDLEGMEFLPKPYRTEDLNRRIRAILDRPSRAR